MMFSVNVATVLVVVLAVVTHIVCLDHSDSCLDVGEVCPPANNTICRADVGGATRCLCRDGQFWKAQDSPCQDVDDLQVTNLQVESTTTNSASLTWVQPLRNLGLGLSYDVSGGGTPGQASPTGVEVTGLESGTRYDFTVTTLLAADQYYSQMSTSGALAQDVWTKPAKPVGNGAALKLSDGSYNFTFDGSPGQVEKYEVTIEGVFDSRVTTSPFILGVQLEPGTDYNYTIVAISGNSETSEALEGTFQVPAEKPGVVSALKSTKQTSTSVSVEWGTPAEPNGKLIGYLVTYSISDSSQGCQEINITCPDCADLWPTELRNSICSRTTDSDGYSHNFLNNDNSVIDLVIERLQAYRIYNVTVQAVNNAGFGLEKLIFPMTSVGAAKSLQELTVLKTGDNTTAGFEIRWKPGEMTGPTTYELVIGEETSRDTGSYRLIGNISVPGYDRTRYNLRNGLLAFWNYRISATAVTAAGNGPTTSKFEQTTSTIPGMVTAFNVQLDARDAQKFFLTFRCPDEKEQNGKLQKYVVRKTTKFDNYEEKEIQHSDCESSYSTENFGAKLIVGQNYTFEVKVFNTKFAGRFSSAPSLLIRPKVPIFGNSPVLQGPPEIQLTEKYVSVTVCASCLVDDSQGKIITVGLFVCIKRDPTQCGAVQVSANTARTYSEARSKGFQVPYLATPPNWKQTLEMTPNQANFTFTVGNEQTCPQNPSIFCNGPLPGGADVVITAISCTEAGCAHYTNPTVYKTQAASDDGAPVGAIVGAIVAVIIVVLVVLGVLYLWRTQRIPWAKNKKSAIADPLPLVRKERPVDIENFSRELVRYHKDSDRLFMAEFEEIKSLSSGLKHTSDEAKREENRGKNRYNDILPYDHSRVKLSIQADEQDTMDFINANYIPGYVSVREYIATQGPMYSTIPDFWRMVWEQNSQIIVMLSDLHEAGNAKVHLYWPPNLHEPIRYGNIVVEMTDFSKVNKYITRRFSMSWGEDEQREVVHFFLEGWKDFSANLSFSDVLEFAKVVRQEATPSNSYSGPLIVHCSAGVGRTGTFIAIDYFLQHLDEHSLDGQIDIFSYVMRMRANRPCMVQAESQYIFIHDALNEVIKQKIEEKGEPTDLPMVDVDITSDQDSLHIYDNRAFAPDIACENGKSPLETESPPTFKELQQE